MEPALALLHALKAQADNLQLQTLLLEIVFVYPVRFGGVRKKETLWVYPKPCARSLHTHSGSQPSSLLFQFYYFCWSVGSLER